MTPPARHVFCEHLPLERLGRGDLLRALLQRRIHPIVAVTPAKLAEVPRLFGRVREAGLRVVPWPMLDSRDGRWASLHTWPEYAAHVERVLVRLDREGLPPDELLVDLEPPIARLRSMLAGHLRRAAISVPHATPRQVEAALRRWRDAGFGLRATVAPPTIGPSRRVARGWQRLLGTPVHAELYDRVAVMAYSSLFEGYARGLLDRADALALLFRMAADAARRCGARASVALGCIGVGALGDERGYRSPVELAEDVAVARAAGVDDLALFALEGALDRGPVEPWLDALVEPGSLVPPATLRALGVRAIASAIGLGAGVLGR